MAQQALIALTSIHTHGASATKALTTCWRVETLVWPSPYRHGKAVRQGNDIAKYGVKLPLLGGLKKMARPLKTTQFCSKTVFVPKIFFACGALKGASPRGRGRPGAGYLKGCVVVGSAGVFVHRPYCSVLFVHQPYCLFVVPVRQNKH